MNSNIQQPLRERASLIEHPSQADVGDLPTQSLPTEPLPQPQHVPNTSRIVRTSDDSVFKDKAFLTFSSFRSRKTVSFLFRVVILLALSITFFLLKNQTQYQGHGAGSGNLYWAADFETGNLSQFAGVHVANSSGYNWGNSSATVVTQGGTIAGLNNDGPWIAPAPRSGKYALGLLVDGPSSDVSSQGTQRAELTTNYDDSVNTERYYGLSVYIPSNPNIVNGTPQTQNYALWQVGCGTSLALQINRWDTTTPYFILGNSANPQNGWAGTWYDIAAVKFDQWIDFTIHVYWAPDSTGYFEVYENGQLMTMQATNISWSGTRASGPDFGTGCNSVNEYDWYRSPENSPNLVYLDDLKIGDTYAIVQPPSSATPTPTPQGLSCIATSASWQKQAIASQTGTFEATFDATPNASGIDTVIGPSQNAAAAYTDLAAIARFNSSGAIDVRNGGSYQAQTTVPYTAGSSYHFRLEVNVPTHTYSIYVTPAGSSEVTLATNDAFRTEQASVTSLNYWSTYSLTGSVNVCHFTIVTATAGGGWVNSGFATQTGALSLSFDATPSVSPMDGVIGQSNGAASDYTQLATIVRFNPNGSIDARNGSAYQAATSIPYTANATYHFRLAIDIGSHTYSAYVTPPGGSEIIIGTNYAFRTEQASVTQLNNIGLYVTSTSGSGTVCNFSLGSTTTPSVTPGK